MSGGLDLKIDDERAEGESELARYSEEFREEMVRKMMPPSSMSVAEVSRRSGVCTATLYNWRDKVRKRGKAVPADPSNPEGWSGENKLGVLIETGALNEHELSEYCRSKGLYPEQVLRWREAAIAGNESSKEQTREIRRELQEERKKSRRLERELRRKEKALAEAAALLLLEKKAQALWGDLGDD